MDTVAETHSNPPVKWAAGSIIAVVLLTMGVLVWFNTEGGTPEPKVTMQGDGAPPLLNFPLLDKADYEQKDDDLAAKYPGELSALDGKKVALAGFMSPFEKLDDMRDFLLLPSSGGCFFCQAPSLTQVVMIHQAPHLDAPPKLPFIQEPLMVTGTLHLYAKGSENPGHKAGFIFVLDNAELTKLTHSAAETAGLTGAPPPVRR